MATLGIVSAQPWLTEQQDFVGAVRKFVDSTPGPISWDDPREATAWMTADEAIAATGNVPLRLSLARTPAVARSSAWLIDALTGSGEEITAFLEMLPGSSRLGWSWPLRVGFLDDPHSQRLREEVMTSRYWPWLSHEVEAADGCDVLLLRVPGLGPDAPLEERRLGAARLVVTLGLQDHSRGDLPMIADRIAVSAGAWGCHVAHDESPGRWFNAFVEAMAHDLPLDAALAIASRGNSLAYTALAPQLIEESRLSTIIDRLALRLDIDADERITVPSAVMGNLPDFPAFGDLECGVVADYLHAHLHQFRYEGESHEATGIAMLMEAAAHLPEHSGLETSAERGHDDDDAELPRILNGMVRRGSLPHELALVAGETYELDVWIGPIDARSITLTGAPAVPIPTEDTTWPKSIDVILVCEDNAEQTRREQVVLARRGPSDVATFPLLVAETGQLVGRIILVYAGRTLQTAIFRADVVDVAPSRIGRPEIEVESIVRASFAEVGGGSDFDLSIVVNRDDQRRRATTAIRRGGVTLRSADGLESAKKEIVDTLTAVADDPDAFATPMSEQSVQLMFDLATIGEALRASFVEDHGIDEAAFAAGRLQIISATPESYLPVELFYAGRAPTVVEYCAGWQDAAQTGECASCASLGPTDEVPVCPAGFWGVRYVIERHAHDPAFVELPGDYRLQLEPIAGRDRIDPFASIVWAMSAKVGAVDQQSLTSAFATGLSARCATSWQQLQDTADLSTAMIFLLPHTDLIRNAPGTEIGDGLLEAVNQIPRRLSAIAETPKVAVLLGCETANPEVPFQGMVPRFRRCGAVVVVSTITPVLGRHAVPVAITLLRLMQDAVKDADVGMGDVLRLLRREALRDGLPMVLSVIAYGDADWKLG